MLDACRLDYINRNSTPFLHDLSKKGYCGPVKPTFGFEPDAAYLAGLYPDEADGGAQFWHAPELSPFDFTRAIPEFFNRLPDLPQKVIRKLIVHMARSKSNAPNLSTVRIPFHLLAKFDLPMKHDLDHPDFCGSLSVFDLLRKNNIPYLFHAAPRFRVTMDAALTRARNHLLPPTAFAFFHIGNLDGTGHRYGPDSKEIRHELACLDQKISSLHAIAKSRFDHVNLVIMGDHGMTKVTHHIDLETRLRDLDISNGKECLYILDSTMARFWFSNETVRQKIKSNLSGIDGGKVLSRTDRNLYHLNWPHNRFGDLIFLTDPGTLIFPNHFQQHAPVKGMHGYAPEHEHQQALLLINSPGITFLQDQTPVDMRQIFPTLCTLLKIDRPAYCSLKGVVKS